MNNFLKAQLLPGEPIRHDQHKKLLLILLFILIAAIALGLTIWIRNIINERYRFSIESNQQNQLTPDQLRVISILNNSPDVTIEQQKSVLVELSKNKKSGTNEKQRAAVIKLMQ